MSGRGAKYWPSPDLTSSAFFSSRPSYMSPRPSVLALYQSCASIASTIARRLRGWRSAVVGDAVVPEEGAEVSELLDDFSGRGHGCERALPPLVVAAVA